MMSSNCVIIIRDGTGTHTIDVEDFEIIDDTTITYTTEFAEPPHSIEEIDPASIQKGEDERAEHVTNYVHTSAGPAVEPVQRGNLSHELPFWTSGFK